MPMHDHIMPSYGLHFPQNFHRTLTIPTMSSPSSIFLPTHFQWFPRCCWSVQPRGRWPESQSHYIYVDPHLGPFMQPLILPRGRALLNHVSSFERIVQNHMLLLKCQWKVDRWHEDLRAVRGVEAASCMRG